MLTEKQNIQKREMYIQLLPHTKFYLKCIIDLNVKAKTIKLYEENVRKKNS